MAIPDLPGGFIYQGHLFPLGHLCASGVPQRRQRPQHHGRAAGARSAPEVAQGIQEEALRRSDRARNRKPRCQTLLKRMAQPAIRFNLASF